MTADQVFVSYSLNDREACVVLRSALEQAGLSVFRDETSIRSGDRWVTRLEAALKACSAFVLLVGRDGVRRWVGAEAQVALIRNLSSEEDAQRLAIFPILLEDVKPEALPPFLALFQATRWHSAEPLPGPLLEAIKMGAPRFDSQAFEGCPFMGLSAFQQKDARLFFGRRRETLSALACLGSQQGINPEYLRGGGGANFYRWLQIDGNSGSGKSSLVNAGMLPMIEEGALWARTGFDRWRILGPMFPGRNPLEKLAEVLERGLIADEAQRESLARLRRLEQDVRALAFMLRDAKQNETAFLLIVDQFEELFTIAEGEPRNRFDAQLANALQDPDCPLFVISTVRTDFLDRLDQLACLGKFDNSRRIRFFLPAISEQGLREVIEGPARLADLDVRAVTLAILEDARDEIGALPLVENALLTLWKRDEKQLSADEYRQLGGIAGMLSAQADGLLARVNAEVPGGREAALELLLRLTRINDERRHTRQRITRDEAVLVAGDGNRERGERVVRLLSGERVLDGSGPRHDGGLRLITAAAEQGEQYVDLIHETLVRARWDEQSRRWIGYWPTLYDYIEKHRDRDLNRQQLKFQTEQWQRRRGLGRFAGLASLGDLRRYRHLRTLKQSPEGRFLARSKSKVLIQALVLAFVVGFAGDSFIWAWKHNLPFESMVMLQRYRLGYAPVPKLLPLPAGSIVMGERNEKFLERFTNPANPYRSREELPYYGVPNSQPVTIPGGLSLGKDEVTYEQYDYYVWEQLRAGHNTVKYPTTVKDGLGTRPVVNDLRYPATAKGGRGTRPVAHVTWYEAAAYAEWLGQRQKKKCRLPNEAEWEYAARAGTDSAYWWGDDIYRTSDGKLMANCWKCGRTWNSHDAMAMPVGTFPANTLGFRDMSGNVWEWTCSLWTNKFDQNKNARGCASPENGNIELVSSRGGSWTWEDVDARLSARRPGDPTRFVEDHGFRVLCSSSSISQ